MASRQHDDFWSSRIRFVFRKVLWTFLPSPIRGTKKKGCSFLKERTKELFPLVLSSRPAPGPESGEKSFCFFLRKKKPPSFRFFVEAMKLIKKTKPDRIT